MTKREMFTAIANVAEVSANAEMVEFLNHEIELLDKKRSSKGTSLTKTQKENVVVKDTIFAVLSENEDALTVSDLLKDGRLEMFSNQKISALLRQMVSDGLVTKTIENKKAKFAVAD